MFRNISKHLLSPYLIHPRNHLLKLSAAMSTIPLQMSPDLKKKYAVIKKIKSCLTFAELNTVTDKHFSEIDKELKTVYLEVLNSLYT